MSPVSYLFFRFDYSKSHVEENKCSQHVLNRGLFVGEFMLSVALFFYGKNKLEK